MRDTLQYVVMSDSPASAYHHSERYAGARSGNSFGLFDCTGIFFRQNPRARSSYRPRNVTVVRRVFLARFCAGRCCQTCAVWWLPADCRHHGHRAGNKRCKRQSILAKREGSLKPSRGSVLKWMSDGDRSLWLPSKPLHLFRIPNTG